MTAIWWAITHAGPLTAAAALAVAAIARLEPPTAADITRQEDNRG